MSFYLPAVILLGVCALAVLGLYAKLQRPYRTALFNFLGGGAGLLAIHLTSAFTGVYLALNIYTAACSLILGVPGVVLMLLAKALMGVS